MHFETTHRACTAALSSVCSTMKHACSSMVRSALASTRAALTSPSSRLTMLPARSRASTMAQWQGHTLRTGRPPDGSSCLGRAVKTRIYICTSVSHPEVGCGRNRDAPCGASELMRAGDSMRASAACGGRLPLARRRRSDELRGECAGCGGTASTVSRRRCTLVSCAAEMRGLAGRLGA